MTRVSCQAIDLCAQSRCWFVCVHSWKVMNAAAVAGKNSLMCQLKLVQIPCCSRAYVPAGRRLQIPNAWLEACGSHAWSAWSHQRSDERYSSLVSLLSWYCVNPPHLLSLTVPHQLLSLTNPHQLLSLTNPHKGARRHGYVWHLGMASTTSET